MAAQSYIAVGADHRSSNAGVRDRLFLDEAGRREALADLRARGVDQAVILSTCDRVEVHSAADDPDAAIAAIQSTLASKAGYSEARAAELLTRRRERDAVRRLFRVACALESAVIGESQVLGQVKEAYGESQLAGSMGRALDALFQSAFAAAKQVRTVTRIGEGAVTVASAAVQTLRDLHGDPARCRLLLVGLGDVGALLLEQFRLAGLTEATLTGASRRVEKAALAAGCHYAKLEDLPAALANADVVVTAASGGRYLIDAETCGAALKKRRGAPILFFDCGAPADIDPTVSEHEQAYLFTLADIERMARDGRFGREDEAEQAARMVEDCIDQFQRDRESQKAVPALVALRAHFEDQRAAVLRQYRRADADEATRLLIQRLLHTPSGALRALASETGASEGAASDMAEAEALLRRLFDLPVSDSDSGAKTVAGGSARPPEEES